MPRERQHEPPAARQRRSRGSAPESPSRRTRPRNGDTGLDLSDEELRALADEQLDPEEVARLAREDDDEQEASDHDRDTTRDRIEGLLLEQEEQY